MGLGMVAIGLAMLFIGVGQNGFKTMEMSLVGPGLVVGGLGLACLRICCCLVCEEGIWEDVKEVSLDGSRFRFEEKNQSRNGLQYNEKPKEDTDCINGLQTFTVTDKYQQMVVSHGWAMKEG